MLLLNFNLINFSLIVKLFFTSAALILVFLAFLLKRQVKLLNRFLKTPLGTWIKAASLLYLITTFATLVLVLLIF